MAMDRTPLNDAEEAWIAKYRSALKDIPVEQSRSTRFHEALNRAHGIIVSHVAGILAGSLDSGRWKRLKSPRFNPQNRCPFRIHKPLETGTWQSRTRR